LIFSLLEAAPLRSFWIFLPLLFLVACVPQTAAPPTPPALASPSAAFPLPPASSPLPPSAQATLSPTDSATPAIVFPNPQAFTWSLVSDGLLRPVDIQHAGDGSGRLFIVEQAGRIRILQNGKLLPLPFLDIRERVGSQGNEQGLLGLAFHPHFGENGYFYVNYTDRRGDTVIARFQVMADPNLADANSEKILLKVNQPFPNHNGGVLTFGPDGYLYAGLGDGGSAGDPFNNAQKTTTLLGKILRLDVDGGDPYRIPPENPFGNEIWAYGLRNPWRISFDRQTGDLWIGDVGQNAWEEIDFLPAGAPSAANFGWSLLEGTHPYNGDLQAGLILPVFEYPHEMDRGGCSVTGGYVYRGAALPEWQGIYLFGDYCTGFVWGLIRSVSGWQAEVLFDTPFNISTFGVDQAGEVYLADLQGAVYRLERK